MPCESQLKSPDFLHRFQLVFVRTVCATMFGNESLFSPQFSLSAFFDYLSLSKVYHTCKSVTLTLSSELLCSVNDHFSQLAGQSFHGAGQVYPWSDLPR